MTVLRQSLALVLGEGGAVGVGFLASSKGHILTSWEALRRAGEGSRYRLVLADGKEVTAKTDDSVLLTGSDAAVAILRLENSPYGAIALPLGFEAVPPVKGVTLCDTEGHFLSGDYLATTVTSEAFTYRMRLKVEGVSKNCVGSPVWDGRRAIGVVVEVDASTQTAEAVPVARVVTACRELSFAAMNPYVGLTPYDENSAHLYFGRKEVVAELLERLRTTRWVTVVGVPGTGKSSLLRAGLIPLLREETNLPVVETLESVSEHSAILLVDPLEDTLDVLPNDEARREWFRRLEVFAEKPNAFVLMSVSSGFLPLVVALSPEVANRRIFPSAYQMPVSVRESAVREMIEAPLKQPGYECLIPYTLTEALLNGLHEAPHQDSSERAFETTQIPLLQLTLWQMWQLQNRRGAYAMSHEDYEAVGPVSDALNRWADDILRGLEPIEEDVAWHLLCEELVLRDGVPRSRWRLLRELSANDQERPVVERVVTVLEDEGLLRSEGVGEAKRVRLAHDLLLTQWDKLRMGLENTEYIRWLRRVRETTIAEPTWSRLVRAVKTPAIAVYRRVVVGVPIAQSRRGGYRIAFGMAAAGMILLLAFWMRSSLREEPFSSAIPGVERLVEGDPQGLVDLANAYLESPRDRQETLRALWSAWYSQWERTIILSVSPSDVVLSSNGKFLATTEGSLWDLETGERRQTAESPFFVSEDRKRVAFFSKGHLYRLDFDSGEPLGKEIPLEEAPSRVVFFGDRLATLQGNRVVVWEGDHQVAAIENEAPLGKISLAGSGDWLVAISGTPKENETTTDLLVWNLVGKPVRRSLNKADDFVVSPTGRFIAAVKNRRSTVELFDTTTLLQSLDRVAEVRTNRVDEVRFSPDESLLITRSYSSERIWDRSTGERLGERVRTILFLSGKENALVLSEDGKLTLRTQTENDTLKETPIATPFEEKFLHAELAEDPNWVVVTSEQAVGFVNLQAAQVTATFRGYFRGAVRDGIGALTDEKTTLLVDPATGERKSEVFRGALIALGVKGRVVTRNDEGKIHLRSRGERVSVSQTTVLPYGFEPLSLAPNGTRGLTRTPHGLLQAFDAQNGKPFGETSPFETTEPFFIRYSPRGRFVAFGRNEYHLLDLKEGKIIAKGKCFNSSFAFDAQEKTFVVAGDATTLEKRRLDTPEKPETFSLRKPLPTSASFDDTLRYLVHENQGTLTLVDVKTGAEKSFVPGGTLIGSVAFDRKGTRLAVPYFSERGAFVNVFDLRSRARTWDLELGTVSSDVAVAFDPDGKRIVASSSSRTICWDANTGEERWSTPIGGTPLTFSLSGRWLLAGGVLLEADTGFPLPPLSEEKSHLPRLALVEDKIAFGLSKNGIRKLSLTAPPLSSEELSERTAALTGFRPRGFSSEPEPLGSDALSELRRRYR